MNNVEKLVGFEAFKKWMEDEKNMKAMYNSGDVRGRFAESVIEQLEGSNVLIADNQNTKGYDINRNGILSELKTTSTLITTPSTRKNLTCRLQVGGLESKRNNCHEIIILDLVNFKRFDVPHDVFFNEMKLYDVKNKGGVVVNLLFLWYGDYNPNKYFLNGNERSESMSHNTRLLGNYQVID